MISEDIKKMMQMECEKEQNEFGTAFFDQHILVVHDYACRLAEFLGADREAVELAAYLHDISAIQDFGNLARHAEISAETAEKILKDKSFNSEKIETIKRCIIPIQNRFK
jgi:putative nucleotidyltransferase with HDIG domain